jgi:uncharacterized membrane protein
MNNDVGDKVREDFKAIRILFMAMVAGIVLFLTVALIINTLQGAFLKNEQVENILLTTALIISVAALFVGDGLYRKRSRLVKDSTRPMTKKITDYRAALILVLALAEFPALLSIISFLITGNSLFIAIVAVIIAFILKKVPTKNKVAETLGYSSTETNWL